MNHCFEERQIGDNELPKGCPVSSDRTYRAGMPKKRPFLGMSECRCRFPRLISHIETLREAPVQRPYIRETLYRSLSRRRG
jgi:hypothetical protein